MPRSTSSVVSFCFCFVNICYVSSASELCCTYYTLLLYAYIFLPFAVVARDSLIYVYVLYKMFDYKWGNLATVYCVQKQLQINIRFCFLEYLIPYLLTDCIQFRGSSVTFICYIYMTTERNEFDPVGFQSIL